MIDLRARYPIPLLWPRLAMAPSIHEANIIHHSVTPTLSAHATEAQEIAWLDIIHSYHISRGMLGIAYHFGAFPSGRVYWLCSLNQWGAGVYKQNNRTYHICLVGDMTQIAATQKHLKAAAEADAFINKFLEAA